MENIYSRVLSLFEQRSIRLFIERIESTMVRVEGLYGYVVNLEKTEDIEIATTLNRLYYHLVWGVFDDASNDVPQTDEKMLFDEFLETYERGKLVLEVGCGSGRLTKYLVRHVERLVAIDSDPLVAQRCADVLRKAAIASDVVRHCDLLSLQDDESFSAVLVMENILGMTLRRDVRSGMYRKISKLICPDGLMLVSVRETPGVLCTGRLYQVMPYVATLPGSVNINTYGFAQMWSIDSMLEEVARTAPELRILHVNNGGLRPAGGVMRSAVLIKA